MTNEIPKSEWKQFFNDLSRENLNWLTKVEVLNDETGAQILSEGLPLGGFAFESIEGRESIEIIIGNTTDSHQTHTISEPKKVYFRQVADIQTTTIEIEDAGNTKTLVHIVQPSTVFVEYFETTTVATF